MGIFAISSERNKSSFAAVFLGVVISLVWSPVSAETRITDDYIAIDVEGEAIDSGDPRWVLTEANTPQIIDDPDPNHSSDAAGNAYLELLPDIRVTHDDPFGPPMAFWGNGGQGPDLNYVVNFPEAGRYFVHVRALSTGSEDNGIHVGLNNEFPPHGLRMQWCSAREGWTWSSAQRGDESKPCGTEKTIWLDVPEQGEHVVNFSAREDGFEFDRFMLIKDLSDNTKICEPTAVNEVSCVAGSLPEADDLVDVGVELVTDRATGIVDDLFTFTATIDNRDNLDTSDNTTISLDLGSVVEWSVTESTDQCVQVGSMIDCDLGAVEPTSVSGHREIFVTAQAISIGDATVVATVRSGSVDENSVNDVASVDVTVAEAMITTELSSVIDAPDTPIREREEFLLAVNIENTGENAAFDLQILMGFPEAIQVISFPTLCSGDTSIQCELAELVSGDTQNLVFALSSDRAGLYPLQARVIFKNSESPAQELVEFVSVVPVDQDAGVSSASDSQPSQPSQPSHPPQSNENDNFVLGGANMLLVILLILGVRLRDFKGQR